MHSFNKRVHLIRRALRAQGIAKVPLSWASPDVVAEITSRGILHHDFGKVVIFCTQAVWDAEIARQQAKQVDTLDVSINESSQPNEVTEGLGNR